IDEELNKKNECRIHKQDWKNREDYKTEIGANNVVYTLIDTENKLIYVGEAIDLIKRFDQGHKVISHWNKYRYNILPKEFEKYRKTIERMSIRDMACLLSNPKGIDSIEFSDYRLVNEKIDI
ncbi:MAG: GIY-YIG nuclease family protein, partial [Clostridiales bacterium]